MAARRDTRRCTVATSTHVDLLPKVKIEMVLADSMVEAAVQALLSSARTGKIGDGKIFLYPVDEAIRIRNEDRGDQAV